MIIQRKKKIDKAIDRTWNKKIHISCLKIRDFIFRQAQVKGCERRLGEENYNNEPEDGLMEWNHQKTWLKRWDLWKGNGKRDTERNEELIRWQKEKWARTKNCMLSYNHCSMCSLSSVNISTPLCVPSSEYSIAYNGTGRSYHVY